MTTGIGISPKSAEDIEWIQELLEVRWGAVDIVTRNQLHKADKLPAFIARMQGKRVGLITYLIDGNQCEIMTVDSLRWGKGIGSTMIEAVKQEALALRCQRLFVVTTNDNLDNLKFYQRRGFNLVALRCCALAESRKLKPQIPMIGKHGIAIRDELELEMPL